MRKFGTFSAGIALAGLMAAASPAAADVTTFASFNATGNNNIVWANSGIGGTDSTYDASGVGGRLYTTTSNGLQPEAYAPAGVEVAFSFLQGALASVSNVSATFTLDLSSASAAINAGPLIFQPGLGNPVASFSIVSNQAIVIGPTFYAAGSNLLSGTLTSGVSLVGINGSTSGSVNGSTQTGAVITYTSDFLNFNSTTVRDFALSLSAITSLVQNSNAGLHAPNGNLRSFKATATGSFSSEPLPVVPEPATWAMMIAGFGLLGVSLRRRRVAVAA